jgi:cell wall-associated NlpC family hydrolase
MKNLLSTLAILFGCAGCATSVQPPSGTNHAAAPALKFQNPALEPANGGRLIAAEDLQAGDILLSAANGITSAGIRIVTLAPVSHAAVYVGDQEIVEAVGQGVRRRRLADVLDEEAVVVAFRHPKLTPAQGEKIRAFALAKVGSHYDHLGIMLQAPFSIERRLCELPLVPDAIRNACIQGIATIQLGTPGNDRFFCSQLVLEAYRQAGLPITDADPRWVSPADILHMREGDVPSMKIHQPLAYLGHLKSPASSSALAQVR